MLSIIYTTGRLDPKLDWFLASLARETGGDYTDMEIIIVDFHFGKPDRKPVRRLPPNRLLHVPPKPTVWQGPHRLTKEDWFAVANTRNTGLCYAHGQWVAFVDDLSFLMPGWIAEVRKAMTGSRIICGAYQKVKDLNIDIVTGELLSFTDYLPGHDNRQGSLDGPIPCPGNHMYGCSLVAPMEAFLSINGYDERCDGLGFEDSIAGIHLSRRGWAFAYNLRMKTLESEELHFVGPQMKRSDYGQSPRDWSHRILELAQKGDGWSPNDFGEFSSLKNLRKHVLGGGEFPKPRGPLRHHFTGVPLGDL